MIESYIFKNDLRKQQKEMHILLKKRKRFSANLQYILEKYIIVNTQILRKLIQSDKLSDKLISRSIICEKYTTNNNYKFDFHRHWIDEYYNSKPIKAQINYRIFFDMVYHSYFTFVCYSKSCDQMSNNISFIFTSDRMKDKEYYKVNFNEINKMISYIINDKITEVTIAIDPIDGCYKIVKRNSK